MFRATTSARGPFRHATAAALAALTAAAAGSAALGACRDVTAPEQDPATVRYADALGIRIADFTRDTSGVYYRDVAVGSGAVIVPNSTVACNYSGYLTDGRLFDSTLTASPLTLSVGAGKYLRGFERGLLGGRSGSRRIVIIPPALGYGNTSQATRIPAGSILIFRIDVGTVTPPATTTTSARAAR